MIRRLLLALTFVVGLSACPADAPVENNPPELSLDVGSTIEYVVGEGVIRIMVTGHDPDGGPVTLGVVEAPERADFVPYDGWGVFSWDPLASDVTPADAPRRLVFYAEDAQGARDERTVHISIIPGNGVPRFVMSPSINHAADSGKPVAFIVEVRDDDSQRVALVMPQDKAPDGATFTITGDKTGRFYWEPTLDQLKHRVHSVTFVANDGANPPVEQRVSILVTKSQEETRPKVPDNPGEPSGCAFEDAVRHTPLTAQRGADDYRVEAYLVGAAAERYDRLALNYSDQDVWNDLDIPLQGAEMTEEEGVFVGTIPNPLVAAGESREIYYQICAIDDDSTDEDAVLCGPTSIFNSFIAYPPASTGCVDDGASNGTFDTALPLLDYNYGWMLHRGCGASAPDVFRMDLEPQQTGDVVFTYPFGQSVTIEMFDQNQNPLPMESSPCSGFAFAYVENMTDQPTTRYFRVVADDVPYQVSPYFYEVTTMCLDEAAEPNERKAEASPLEPTGMASGHICGPNDVDVWEVFLNEGEQLEVIAAFAHADGDLDMKLFAPEDHDEVDSNGLATSYSLSVDDDEEIVYVATETGTHYVVVFGYGTDNTYTLTTETTAAMVCEDTDSFVPNQTVEEAKELDFQVHSGLQLCGGGTDWFSFLAFENEFITVTIRVSEGAIEDVNAELYLDGSPEETGFQNGDKITIEVLAFQTQTYDLKVTSASPVTYEISLAFSI